ncbi:MAG: hypothetical protein H6917_10675 [Novosphingobium sp.]|nr:hypothetical protein [Novosphingobium sp.]MCP5402836.1 hypothetical protein [Novosphingobium sp.]
MTKSIRPVRTNHMNLVLENVEASADHFRQAYGAELLADMPQRELHAYLFEIGRVIFEVFVPYEFLLNARYGPHYVGIEYQADIDEVREAIAERGIRIVRDIGLALHTHPADCFGVSFEFYGGYFHDREWDMLDGAKMLSAEYWRDEHPLGLTGLKAYTVAVSDIDAASAFMQGFLSGDPVYEASREGIAGRAVGLQVCDAVLELVTPMGEGILQRHLQRYGDGIRSTVFGVRDIEQARRYFADRGIETEPGGAPDSFAVAETANLGVIFEFRE